MRAIGQLAGASRTTGNLLQDLYCELLQQRLPAHDPLRAYVTEIAEAGQRASALTTQLLAFGRKQILRPLPIDLNDVIDGMDRLLRRLVGEEVQLETRLDRELGTVRADPGQVEQVLMNLVLNARDAMPRGGRVIVETRNEWIAAGSAPDDRARTRRLRGHVGDRRGRRHGPPSARRSSSPSSRPRRREGNGPRALDGLRDREAVGAPSRSRASRIAGPASTSTSRWPGAADVPLRASEGTSRGRRSRGRERDHPRRRGRCHARASCPPRARGGTVSRPRCAERIDALAMVERIGEPIHLLLTDV
jgi:hypothetical protein